MRAAVVDFGDERVCGMAAVALHDFLAGAVMSVLLGLTPHV